MRHHSERLPDHRSHHGRHGHHDHHDHHEWFLIGRHRHGGGRGLGGIGGGFMGEDGLGGRGLHAGRKLGSADLQLLVLSLLADQPRHGYEIIKALDERSGGFYVPSPGMVYPALTYLEEIGYATVEAEGARKRYHVTEAGSAHLAANRDKVDAIFMQLARAGEKMERMRQAFSDDAESNDFGSGHGGPRELHQARRALKAAVSDARDSAPEDQRRIADILQRAADEIRSIPSRRS